MRKAVVSRRAVLKGTSASLVLSSVPSMLSAGTAQQHTFDPRPGVWRTFEVTTTVQLREPAGRATVWVPVPALDSSWQRPLGSTWRGNARSIGLAPLGSDASCVVAQFDASTQRPAVEVVSRVQTLNRATDWSQRARSPDSRAELGKWLQPKALAPTDGIVRKIAQQITLGTRTDVEKARRIYEWILVSTYRDPKVRGCGTGDIRAMLESGNLGGKCVDINGLFVGLCRASGVPAREAYGVRLAPSEFGYRETGASSSNLTGAQHCRAEVHLRDHGWVAADPADVSKVMRQESGEWIQDLGHPLIAPLRRALFGAWEGNWTAYNREADVKLPGSEGPPLPFVMYPQAENEHGRYDSLDAERFRYSIAARELAA